MVSFAEPFHGQGVVDLEGDGWLVAVLPPSQVDSVSMSIPAGQGWYTSSNTASVVTSAYTSDLNSPPEKGDLVFEGGESVAVGATDVVLKTRVAGIRAADAAGLEARLSAPGQLLMDDESGVRRLSTLAQVAAVDQTWFALDGRLVLDDDLQDAEIFGLRCSVCPEPERRVQAPSGTVVQLSTWSPPPGTQINIAGHGSFFFFLHEPTLSLNGTARLASLDSSDQQHSTLTLEGSFRLANITRAAPGRMQADLDQQAAAVFVDEGRMTPVVAASVAAAGGFTLVALGLVAHEILKRPLRNEKREMVHQLVSENPGIHYQGLRRSSGLGNGALSYSLRILEMAGLVRSESAGRRKLYFLATADGKADVVPDFGESDEQLLARILGLVQSQQASTRVELLQFLVPDWSRATVYRGVRRLVEAGALVDGNALAVASPVGRESVGRGLRPTA